MTAVGDIVLTPLPTLETRQARSRPAVVLSELPGAFQRWLVCGISTQLWQVRPDWDEVIDPGVVPGTGLVAVSAVRLSYLGAIAETGIRATIGRVDAQMVGRLVERLANHLRASGV